MREVNKTVKIDRESVKSKSLSKSSSKRHVQGMNKRNTWITEKKNVKEPNDTSSINTPRQVKGAVQPFFSSIRGTKSRQVIQRIKSQHRVSTSFI